MAETKKLAEVDMVEYTDNTSLICEQDGKIRRISAGKVLGDTILSATSTNIVTGEKITISDSLEAPLAGLNIYGKSMQKTTTGANLFDGSEYGKKTSSGVTIEWLQDEGCFLLNGTATETDGMMTSIDIVAEKGATYALQNYYVSGEISVPANGSAVSCFGASDTEGLFNDWLGCSLKEEDTNCNSECNYSYITAFWFYITTGVVLNNYKVRIQLAKSSAPLPYEPYTGGVPSPNGDYPQEIQTISDFVVEVKNSMGEVATPQTLNITIPEQGFYGIPVSSGGNYTDASGQQWICDEFDFANKKFIKRTARFSFDGSKDETWVRTSVQETAVKFSVIPTGEKIRNAGGLCNRLIYKSSGVGLWVFNSWQAYLIINVEPSINTVNLLREYLNTHPLDIIYSLETPVEYNLTDAEMQAFEELHTYKPNTTIMSDSEPQAGMKVEYALDMKTYVDNKFLELATQVLENA